MLELLTPQWLNPAGGLRYHWRARRHRALWAPFRAALAPWLRAFARGYESLILVGPSAAYALEDEFLARFRRLTVLDPDPSAIFLLRRRCARLRADLELHVSRRDLLIAPLSDEVAGLPEFLAARREHAVLFCNVLGQVSFLMPEGAYPSWQAAFRRRVWPVLQQSPWFSFHDRISSNVAPKLTLPVRNAQRLGQRACVEAFYPTLTKAAADDLFDHQTLELFPLELRACYLDWQIDPSYHHLIEVLGSSLVDTAGS